MIKNLSKPFKWFFQLEAASGLILLVAAIIALFISNSHFSDLYFNTLEQYFLDDLQRLLTHYNHIFWTTYRVC